MQSHPDDPSPVDPDLTLQDEAAKARELQQYLAERQQFQRDAATRSNTRKLGTFSWFQAKLQPWLIPACGAAVLAYATYTLLRLPADAQKQPSAKPKPAIAAAEVAKSKPAVLATPAASLFIAQGGPLSAADFPKLDLPVKSGSSSLSAVRKAVLNDGKLPTHSDVRLNELLSSLPIRLEGTSSIARSAALKENGMSAHVATLSTEILPCPWKPSSTLLILSLRGNSLKDSQIKVSYQPNPGTTSRYRLLGFPPTSATTTGEPPSLLPANAIVTLALEIEASKPDSQLGTLVWTADAKAAPSIPLAAKPSAQPSDDARFAALICTYAQWLSSEQTGVIDASLVSALAKESASSTLSIENADFLRLIEKSLRL